MPRNRKRICLEEGPSLNLPWLFKGGFVKADNFASSRSISWNLPGCGVIARGLVAADLTEVSCAWLMIWIADFSQKLRLIRLPRHFGGGQWYFMCPSTGRLASVLWKPPGAEFFASRHAWPRQVAYQTQFGSWIDRAHLGKARINACLSNSDAYDSVKLPARPPGMHRQTYEELGRRFYAYQEKLDGGFAALAAKLPSR